MSDNGAHEQPGADTLEQAVRTLLRSVPETWSEYDRAALTEPCEQGLALLVAAGMVEQRWSFRLRMFGHPVVVEATARVTGEYGAVEALERVAAGVWEQWGQAWQERMKGPTKDAPAFHCERIGREQWRLTADGIRAREDLETDAATVFDFVLKRGFFDGWSRLSPDGRISQRLSVRGRGVLEKLELVTADAPGPAGVSIANWDQGATAFADALTRRFAAMQAKALLSAESSAPIGGTSTPTKRKRSTQRGEARVKLIAALTKHHDYANGGCLNLEPIGSNELARMAGVSESTASAFLAKEFGGYGEYRKLCGDAARLTASLKLLNQEYSPYHLFGVKPPGEDERADES